MPLTAAFSANAIGCCARLKRSICSPFCLAQSTSAEKVTKAWSTSVPQTPLLQHRAGSNTCTFFMMNSLGIKMDSTRQQSANVIQLDFELLRVVLQRIQRQR